ncbi:sensor histidine kinase [Acetobacterium tundrae]|uniref:histidine kinase n=1 Tax=Acetobacterium tundrae TaxID=132932 RepID=A0ABR6WHI6_9FIRM|nr:HAMP domain-containing sensor histidine kinase [Acetobacterium tundrae]MBC3795936.1 hypothetical protein [Acetobacterium tundrae]
MKNNKQSKTNETKNLKATSYKGLSSVFLKYLVLAFLGAVGLNLILTLIIIPFFSASGLWLTILLNLIPNFFIIIVFTVFFSKKISYIKEIRNETQMLKAEIFEGSVSIQGKDELTAIAENINILHQLYERKSKAENLVKLENHHIITSVSKKIHSPLTGVIGYLERIQNEKEHNFLKKEAYLNTALKKAYLMKNFIDELFEHAFTDDGKGYYQFKIYNGKPLLNRIIDTTTQALEEGGFNVVLENCLDQDFSLWVDLEQIQRIFDNLVSNIIKYADPDKPVDFGLILNKNELCIVQRNKTISDSENSGKTVIETDGSSLDSCKKIIARHQGRIDYYQLNQMFKVELTLPIHQ